MNTVQTAAVIGGVLGGLALILAVGLLVFIYRRRKREILPEAVQSPRRAWMSVPNPFSVCQRSKSPPKVVTSDHHPNSRHPRHPTPIEGHDSRTQSILEWQQNTQRATALLERPPPDMSEELSSYYEEATATDSRRIRTPPPPPRRYIITNK